jgi:hypothetical protein
MQRNTALQQINTHSSWFSNSRSPGRKKDVQPTSRWLHADQV